MSKPVNLHADYILGQVARNLIGLQRDMRSNAQTHKSLAVSQSVPLEKLQRFVDDCASEYLRRIKWVTDFNTRGVDDAQVQQRIDRKRASDTEANELVNALAGAATNLQNAPKSNFAEIAAACEAVLTSLVAPETPPSIWPE